MLRKNVVEKYKEWDVPEIRLDVQRNTFPYFALMENWSGDFNQATLIRNANAFGCRKVFYLAHKKKWDRRGAVGTHNYTSVNYLRTLDDFLKIKDNYRIVVVENNTNYRCDPINKLAIQPNTMFVFGSEGNGVSKEILDLADQIVYIPQFGSIPSINVGVCSGIFFQKASEYFKATAKSMADSLNSIGS